MPKRSIGNELTPREKEIADLVSVGECNRFIADMLNIADGSLRNHLNNIYAKRGFSNRS